MGVIRKREAERDVKTFSFFLFLSHLSEVFLKKYVKKICDRN